MANPFKGFEYGIRLYPSLSADPSTGKVGEMYYNSTLNSVRLCTNSVGPVWNTIGGAGSSPVAAGTVDGSSTRWNNSLLTWVENTGLIQSGSSMSAPAAAAGTNLTLAAGSANAGNNNGGNLLLNVGAGFGSGNPGTIRTNALLMKSAPAPAAGFAFTLQAGDAAPASNANGGDATLQSGAGDGSGVAGNANVIGKSISLTGNQVRLNTAAATDPVSLGSGSQYFNSDYLEMRFNDGSAWRHANQLGLPAVDLRDSLSVVFPNNPQAFLVEQDITYTAVTPGVDGNNVSIEYQDTIPAVAADRVIQDLTYVAVTPGAAGNTISIEYIGGGTAGSEGVSVSTNAIQVQIEDGVSTASQIVTAVLGYGPSAALVNVSVTGSDVAQTLQAPTFLQSGADAIGTAGNENVTVLGSAIKIIFASGVSTASQIKTAFDLVPAATALASATITGVGSNPQTAPVAPTNLAGGISSLTIDGVLVTNNMLVLFTNLANGAQNNRVYKADTSGSAIVWTLRSLGKNVNGAPAAHDFLFIDQGTIWAQDVIHYDAVGVVWDLIGSQINSGTVNNSTAHWSTALQKWVENVSILNSTNLLSSPDDAVNDAAQASSLSVHAGNKTAGTGDGGDLNFDGGTSVGGAKGKVKANKLVITDLGGVGAASASLADDATVDAVKAANLTLQAANKTAGTGDGGDLNLNAGTSTGGALGVAALNTALQLPNLATAPATPSAGFLRQYAETNNGVQRLRVKTSDGTVLTHFRDVAILVQNTTGGTLTKGTVVYINGAATTPTVAKAKADVAATTPAAGVVLADIADTAYGLIAHVAIVANFDTSALTAGQPIYLSAGTAGLFTSTKPSKPNLVQRLGTCITSHATTGSIQFRVQEVNGLPEQGSVTASTPAGGSYPYTILPVSERIVIFVDTTAARTINLPDPASKCIITLKDISGSSETNNILLVRFGSETIEGAAANYSYGANYGSLTLISDGTNWWFI